MAITSDDIYVHMNHRLFTEYDQDMTVCEDLVRFRINPTDSEAQDIVRSYYMSRLRSYWRHTKEWLTNPITEATVVRDKLLYSADASHISNLSRLQNSLDTLDSYFQRAFTSLDDAEMINIPYIHNLFMRISSILCLVYIFRVPLISDKQFAFDPSRIGPSEKVSFPLPNDTGLFGLNSYLYAYFWGVLLEGVPLTHQTYDLRIACPGAFMKHDVRHSKYIRKYAPRGPKYKALYYRILNDPEILQTEKEMLILNLWTVIHEVEGGITSYEKDDLEKFLRELVRFPGVMADFRPEYERFYPFALEDGMARKIRVALESKNPIFNLYVTYELVARGNQAAQYMVRYHPQEDNIIVLHDILYALDDPLNASDPAIGSIALAFLVQGSAYLRNQALFEMQ